MNQRQLRIALKIIEGMQRSFAKEQPQTVIIYNYLLKGHTITSMQAFKRFGITRLADCVYKLNKQGANVKSTLMRSGSRSWAEYSL